ncbi:MAG: ABC transporter permease [Deltaproteobacteria bacterium]|nr:ABC transporter permease [Deltaproteobacteria bacterium]
MLNSKIKIGGSIILVFALLALFAPWLAPYLPGEMNWTLELQPPNAKHWLGQDDFGRDILSRVLYGARLSLGVGLVTVVLSATLGVFTGLLAGYVGGKVEELFIFVSDLFMSFPGILLLIAVAAFVPPSVVNIILVLSFVGWVSYARIIRAQTLELREREFVLASRALGARRLHIMLRHILPNALGPLIVAASLGIAGIILAESTLSFLGIGIPPEIPTWGGMLNTGVRYLLIAPHLAFFPGLAIMLTVLGFNFLGDGLRDMLAKK